VGPYDLLFAKKWPCRIARLYLTSWLINHVISGEHVTTEKDRCFSRSKLQNVNIWLCSDNERVFGDCAVGRSPKCAGARSSNFIWLGWICDNLGAKLPVLFSQTMAKADVEYVVPALNDLLAQRAVSERPLHTIKAL
jgi:hypothetical protein